MELEKVIGNEFNLNKSSQTKTISTSGKILIGLTGMSNSCVKIKILWSSLFFFSIIFIGGLGIAFSLVVYFHRYATLLIPTPSFQRYLRSVCGTSISKILSAICTCNHNPIRKYFVYTEIQWQKWKVIRYWFRWWSDRSWYKFKDGLMLKWYSRKILFSSCCEEWLQIRWCGIESMAGAIFPNLSAYKRSV